MTAATNPGAAGAAAARTAAQPLDTAAWSAERARVQGAIKGGDFSALIGLQRRTRELAAAAKAPDPAGSAAAANPADHAAATSKRVSVEKLEQLATAAGPNPGSRTRHALALAVMSVEKTGSLSFVDAQNVRLAISADAGRVKPEALREIRTTVQRIGAAMDRATEAAQDPTLVQDPDRIATFQQRMKSMTDAARALDTFLAGAAQDPRTIEALRSAGRQINDGHVVRDTLAALRP
jgi:hypothetical protein